MEMKIKCQSSVGQDVNGVSIKGLIEGIDWHLTTNTFSTHDPFCLHSKKQASMATSMKVDLGQNVRLVISFWRYVVSSFRCGVSSFRHTDSPGRLVVFRGRLRELSVRLVILRARHIRLSFCRFVVSLWHFVVSMCRFIVSTRRLIEAIIRLTLHEVLLGSIHQIHEVFIGNLLSVDWEWPTPQDIVRLESRLRSISRKQKWDWMSRNATCSL